MKLEGKRILITGGAGFIGSHLVDRLLAEKADITVADNDLAAYKRNLSHVSDKIKFVEWDITDYKSSDKLERNFEVVVHLAAHASPSFCEKNPEKAFKVNVLGTYNVLRLASESNAKRLIFPSSAGLYGTYPKYIPIDEDHPIEIANSVYNVTKRIGEDLCRSFSEKHDVPVTVLRLFTTFGPKQTPDYFFPTLILQAIQNGKVELWNEKPTRDFNFVENTVDAFVKAAESDFVGGPINIGYGKEVSIGEIARKISSDFGVDLTFLNKEVVGPMRLHCNNDKAKKALGWEPSVSFEEGLSKTIAWYKENHKLFSVGASTS